MSKYYDNYIGIVITPASEDPEGRNRVQVWVPHLSNTLYKDWNNTETDKSFYNLDPNQEGGLTQEQIKRLREVLPWAECAAPVFGGGAAFAQNYATGETSTSVAAIVEDGQEKEQSGQLPNDQTVEQLPPPQTGEAPTSGPLQPGTRPTDTPTTVIIDENGNPQTVSTTTGQPVTQQ